MKATAEEYNIHQRILARDDPVAFAALAEWLYYPLVQDVRRRAGPHADPTEQRVVMLILNKTRSPEPYAQVLGICHLPYDERIREVRRVKYRITKRLRRGIAQQLDRIGGNVQ